MLPLVDILMLPVLVFQHWTGFKRFGFQTRAETIFLYGHPALRPQLCCRCVHQRNRNIVFAQDSVATG